MCAPAVRSHSRQPTSLLLCYYHVDEDDDDDDDVDDDVMMCLLTVSLRGDLGAAQPCDTPSGIFLPQNPAGPHPNTS